MGAKVMHPYSIIPCVSKNIPIIVRNTFNLMGNSTKISNLESFNKNTFIAVEKNISLFKIKSIKMWNAYGFLADIFRIFEKNSIDINIISTSQFSVFVTTNEKNILKLNKIVYELAKSFSVEIINKCSMVSAVSEYIENKIKKINFKDIKYHLFHVGSNRMTLNFIVDENETTNTILSLYRDTKST